MLAYFIRRLLLVIPTLLGCTLLFYTIARIAPGGPIEQMQNEMIQAQMQEGGSSTGDSDANPGEMTEEQRKKVMEDLGLSDNIFVDYCRWMGGVVRLDFGKSTRYKKDVLAMIGSKVPISLFYGLMSLCAIYAVCIPLGIMKAIKHQSFMDTASSIIVFIGYAIPGYALGCLLVVFVAADWQILPLGGFVSDNFAELRFGQRLADIFTHAILPICCYLVQGFAFMTMLMKNQLMDNMAADYVRTALAKGVPYKRAVFKHALDNSLIPIATTFGNQLTVIISGSFLIEKIFDIDGMGMLGFTALMDRDYPVMCGLMVIATIISLLANIISDLCVSLVDPRVKFA